MSRHKYTPGTARTQPFPTKIIVVGNPDNRRVALFQTALANSGFPPAIVVSYEDLLAQRIALSDIVVPGSLVRIESPGENFEVEKALLRAGESEALSEGGPCLSHKEIQGLSPDLGLILNPRQSYLGYRKLLIDIAQQLGECEGVTLMSQPTDITTMFDKRLCHALCLSQNVPVPDSLGHVGSYEELIDRMNEARCCRVFVKLAHGSSASGVVALYVNETRQQAITSVELVHKGGEVQLYNSLKMQSYRNPTDIATIVDTIISHGVHVEEWLPKASCGNGVFDLRIVAIGGVARHFVVRQSRSPMTNLHLGNRRGDADEFLARIGSERWRQVRETCERTAELFPESLHVGVDICLTPGFRRHAVLEVNAFGDLLPGILCDGQDTYTAEIAQVCSG
jgi:hypothetical protein